METSEKETGKHNFYIEPSRIQDWTDGIFAFSMTLLIVGVAMPEISGTVTEQLLKSSLVGMIPTFATFVLSFVLIAVFWMVHHKQFQSIVKSNDTLVWINIALMLLVVFMPFTTNLIDDYGYLKVASVAFNLNMFLIGVLFYVQYAYSASHGLFDKRISKEHISYYKKQNSLIAVISLAALVTGFFSASFSSYFYLLLPFLILYMKKTRKAEKGNNHSQD